MIRVFVAFDDAVFGQRLFEYLNEQPDFQVCGIVELGDEAVREASARRPDIAILEMSSIDDLVVANAFQRRIPDLPLLVVVAGSCSTADASLGPVCFSEYFQRGQRIC